MLCLRFSLPRLFNDVQVMTSEHYDFTGFLCTLPDYHGI